MIKIILFTAIFLTTNLLAKNITFYNGKRYNPVIKMSPDKKTQAVLFESEYIEEVGDGEMKVKMMEISSENKTYLFSNLTKYYDWLGDKFEFISNNRLLITFGSATASSLFVLYPDTKEFKKLSGSSAYEIRTIGNQYGIYVHGLKSYHKKGGAFWYDAYYDIDGNIISYFYPKQDGLSFEIIVSEWDDAHNEKDLEFLKELYANRVDYYTKNYHGKEEILSDKQRLLKKFPSFHQKSKVDKIVKLDDKRFKVYISKNVHMNSIDRVYKCYLIIELDGGKYSVVAEKDI